MVIIIHKIYMQIIETKKYISTYHYKEYYKYVNKLYI